MIKNKPIVILVPYRKDFRPNAGSNIRIMAYTKGLMELKKEFLFMSVVRPDYVPVGKHLLFSLPQRFSKLIVLHNLFYASIFLRWFSFVLHSFIAQHSAIKKLSRATANGVLWTHQDNVLGTYLTLRNHREVLYDIHGILHLQKENREGMNGWKRFWFSMSLRHEKLAFKTLGHFNAVSEEMIQYIMETFRPQRKPYLAPDGIPHPPGRYRFDNSKAKRVLGRYAIPGDKKFLLFAGSLKKIGGVQDLVDVYCSSAILQEKYNLVIAGRGQMAATIRSMRANAGMEQPIIFIDSLPHEDLVQAMHLAAAIVCPDIVNEYNRMVPHIKMFDAIATGNYVVAPRFTVNEQIMPGEKFQNILYYTPGDTTALLQALIRIPETHVVVDDALLTPLTYASRVAAYINQYLR